MCMTIVSCSQQKRLPQEFIGLLCTIFEKDEKKLEPKREKLSVTASGKLDYQAQISSHSFEGNLTDCQIIKAWQMRRKLSQAILCYSYIMSIYNIQQRKLSTS